MTPLSKRISKIIRAGFTQAQIARAAKISTNTPYLWIKGETKSIKLEVARAIEKLTGFRAEWIVTGEPPERVGDSQIGLGHVAKLAAYDDEKIVTVLPYGDDADPSLEPATYRLGWFQRRSINPERTYRVRATGERMEPLLFDGDYALVNTDEKSVVDGKMYALDIGDGAIMIGYLSKRLDGSLVVRSMNPKYEDETVPADQASRIIGRVRETSGTGGT